MACSQFPRRQQPDRLLSTIGLKESVKPLIDKWNTINVLNPFITCNSERLIHISVSIDGFYSRPNTTMVNEAHNNKNQPNKTKQMTNGTRQSTLANAKVMFWSNSLSLFLCFYFGCKQCNVVRPSCMVRKATPAQTTIFRISKTDLSIAVFCLLQKHFFAFNSFCANAIYWPCARLVSGSVEHAKRQSRCGIWFVCVELW